MSDHRRRQAERAARKGTLEDRIRLLVERSRAGDLTQQNLELAAYCGDPAARETANWPGDPKALCPCALDRTTVSGRLVVRHTVEGHDLEMSRVGPLWVAGLQSWGREISVRAAQAAGRVAEERWKDGLPYSFEEGGAWADTQSENVGWIFAAVDAWLACPCEAHRVGCIAASPVLEEAPLLDIATCGHYICMAVAEEVPSPAVTDATSIAFRIVGDHVPIRDAICQTLIELALR